jgi:hypothetical protein
MPVGEAIRGIIGTENIMDVADNTDLITTDFVNATAGTRSFFAVCNRNFVFHRQFRNYSSTIAIFFVSAAVPNKVFLYASQNIIKVESFSLKSSHMPTFSFGTKTESSGTQIFPMTLRKNSLFCNLFLSFTPNISSGENFPASVFAVFYGALLLSFEVCERQHLFDNPLNFIHD